ncbi:hypothetical protein U9M48_041611 [Paspalum notatum var. saurae]|uniref:Uncharacterized protein n=1 Tax=Paspalum notatum var. saurae TaxID=547442 RepID=A0AAQ3UUX5_PASNO
MACFITLCEAFLGIAPHFKLWCYLFRPQLSQGQGGQSLVGGVTIQLRNGRRQDYLQIPFPSSIHAYSGEWFYVQNLGDPSLADGIRWEGPAFTGATPLKRAQWDWGREKKSANQVGFLLEKIGLLHRRGLIGVVLVSTFIRRAVQPLRFRRFPMWEYTGAADPDRISGEELTPAEIRLRVIAITEGTSTANFFDGPLALNHLIKEDLGIGSMKSSLAPLPEDAAVKADRKQKREAEAYLAGEREKRHQLVRDRKKRERDQRAREEGRSPTPSTASSDEEWSSDDTLDAVPLAGKIGESSGSGVLPEAMLIMTPPAAGAVPPLRGSQGSAGESQRVPIPATVAQARVEPVVEVPPSPEPEGSGVPVVVLTSTDRAGGGVRRLGGARIAIKGIGRARCRLFFGRFGNGDPQGSPPGSESSLPVGASAAPVASDAPGPPLRVDAPSVPSPSSANVPLGTASRGWRRLFPMPRSSR